jgi:hypothetical protein
MNIFDAIIACGAQERLDIAKAMDSEIEKGKSFPVGTVHNGFKKVGEGKWQKVSEHGLTKDEHKNEYLATQKSTPKKDQIAIVEGRVTEKNLDMTYEEIQRKAKERNQKESLHREAYNKLDNQEYSDADVLGTEKKEDFSISLDKSGRPEFEEYTRPNYVEITLSGGKKIKFSEKRNIAGGQKLYQSILQGLDTYHENDKAKNFIDKLVAAAAKDLTSKG